MGREAVDLAVEFGSTGIIPQPPPGLTLGIPADLVRRRPDVRRAERELASQCARIGIAETELYPHIFVTGAIGVSSKDVSKLFNSQSWVGFISPNFTWNILNYWRIRNNITAEKAVFARLDYAYRQTVLNAVREAEDAQVAYVYAFDRAKWLTLAVEGAVTAVQEIEKTFEEGTTESGRVYILQAALLSQQELLAGAQADIITSLIGVFKAMGGGWEIRQPLPPAPPQEVLGTGNAPTEPAPELPPPPLPYEVRELPYSTSASRGQPTLGSDQDRSPQPSVARGPS